MQLCVCVVARLCYFGMYRQMHWRRIQLALMQLCSGLWEATAR